MKRRPTVADVEYLILAVLVGSSLAYGIWCGIMSLLFAG